MHKEEGMFRTQIYLTDAEKEALTGLSRRIGKSQSELIRQAIDAYIAQATASPDHDAFTAAAGMWADRTDFPDWQRLRAEWNRFEP